VRPKKQIATFGEEEEEEEEERVVAMVFLSVEEEERSKDNRKRTKYFIEGGCVARAFGGLDDVFPEVGADVFS
jgi:hypothetical protein